MKDADHSHNYFLTAAQCNAQKELPVGTLIQQIIDVATEHANIIGVGARRLSEDNNTWVLSRVAYEIDRYPKIEENYSITTWVESFARFFSQRNFEIKDSEGCVIGRVRTTWACINRDTRHPADISELSSGVPILPERPCQINSVTRIRPINDPDIENEYSFYVSDIDFNRHVNSVRYVDLFINQLSLSTYDEFYISRFEIVFQNEAYFGDKITVASNISAGIIVSQISNSDKLFCLNRIILSRRSENMFMEKREHHS